jgi:hypothetical protein
MSAEMRLKSKVAGYRISGRISGEDVIRKLQIPRTTEFVEVRGRHLKNTFTG